MTGALPKLLIKKKEVYINSEVVFGVKKLYTVASNKRRVVHLIFDIFWGAFIQGSRLYEGGVYHKIQQEADIFKISANMRYICSKKFETS